MLIAETEDGKRICATDAKKRDENGNLIPYYCPECGADVILRQGTKNVWHFSHKNSDLMCNWLKGGGESIEHENMKYVVKEIIERDNRCLKSELEWRIGNRIADYYFEVKDRYGNRKKVAVECVHKHTDIDEYRKKTQYYARNNIHVLWVFNLSRFSDGNYFKPEIRINEIMKECHTMYYGKVYAVDISTKEIYGIHLDAVFREVEEQRIIDWSEWIDGVYQPDYVEEHTEIIGGYEYVLRKTKSPNPMLIEKFAVSSFNRAVPDRWLSYSRTPCGPYMDKWWD